MNFAWPRYLGWTRVALAAVALLFTYQFVPPSSSTLMYGLVGAYLVYSIIVAARVRATSGMLGLLALFGDTVYFLIVAAAGGEPMRWLGTAFFLYLLTEALVFYGTLEVVVVCAVSVVFCAVLPEGGWVLERMVIVGGVLACAFAATTRAPFFN